MDGVLLQTVEALGDSLFVAGAGKFLRERNPDATCPELGVVSQGGTNDEAESMLQEAVELLLEEADEAEIRRRLN